MGVGTGRAGREMGAGTAPATRTSMRTKTAKKAHSAYSLLQRECCKDGAFCCWPTAARC